MRFLLRLGVGLHLPSWVKPSWASGEGLPSVLRASQPCSSAHRKVCQSTARRRDVWLCRGLGAALLAMSVQLPNKQNLPVSKRTEKLSATHKMQWASTGFYLNKSVIWQQKTVLSLFASKHMLSKALAAFSTKGVRLSSFVSSFSPDKTLACLLSNPYLGMEVVWWWNNSDWGAGGEEV